MSTKEAKFKPETEKVVIKPIMKVRNPLVSDPNHEAYFLFGTSTIKYSLPIDKYGHLINPFKSEEEQKWLEEELDLDLNYHKPKDKGNQWYKLKVALGKESKELDLRNPKQYLEYVILRANSLFIAPSFEESKNKATYRYMIVSVDQDVKNNASDADLKIDAYMALGTLKNSKEDMVNFLKVYGKRVDNNSKESFLLSELKNIVETDTEGFLNIWNDKDSYDIKLLINDALEAGAIIKKGREYTLPGGDPLCNAGEKATINVAVAYLKNPKNQDILTTIQTRIKNFKK